MIGIPWRVAFALQADGWYLRSDIIWSKPNPMPESVTDRPTKAHEYVFLLTKAERYFYDAEAIKEAALNPGAPRYGDGGAAAKARVSGGLAVGCATHMGTPETGRNKRTVWEVATAPFAEAHFATFPPALIEPMIKAGTSEKGCCAKCGAPWGRDVEREASGRDARGVPLGEWSGSGVQRHRSAKRAGESRSQTLGWSPSCACDAPFVPCTVLDVFGGAGTTGLVSDRLQRSAVLIELNPEYSALAEKRIYSDAGGLFAAVGVDTPKSATPQAHPSLLSALETTP